MYTVYILYSEKIDKYYVGYTNDLERRIAEHNRRKGKFTDRGIPWAVVHTETFGDKEAAQGREAEIKARKSKQYIIELISACLQQNPAAYNNNGEMHYDIVSAFMKSIRGSDPYAAIYWLARKVEGGEDPTFIACRLVISAAEDFGLANPNALLLAYTGFDAINKIGWPEGRIVLSETAIYLANSPKSNTAYSAVDDAIALVKETGNLPVPLHLRNAPSKLMKQLGYGKEYNTRKPTKATLLHSNTSR